MIEAIFYLSFFGLIFIGAIVYAVHETWKISYARAYYNRGCNDRDRNEYNVPDPGLETFWYNLGQSRRKGYLGKLDSHRSKQLDNAKKKGWIQ